MATITAAPSDDQRAADDATHGLAAALAHRRARSPPVGLRVVGLDRRERMTAIPAAEHPHLPFEHRRACMSARAAQRGDRPPPPARKQRALGGGDVASTSPREDDGVLGISGLETLLGAIHKRWFCWFALFLCTELAENHTR